MAVNMQQLRYLSFILVFVCIFDYNYSLNVEELQLLQCKVDIQEAPIKKGEEPSGSTLHVDSQQGHEYTCILPQDEEENTTEQIPVSINSTEIEEQLEPMESGPCLRKQTGWWTEKVCFGRNIEQYHVKDGRINSYVIVLGVYASDYDDDWSNDIDQNKSMQGERPYYSQYYVNGTECGYYSHVKTGQLRSTEVRFYCEEGVEDYIHDVEEPNTCRYVIKVHTSRLCSIPGFKLPPPKKEKPIPCHPLLDEEQYHDYMEKLNGV